MTTFSVIICTYNRPDMLEMALNALIDRTEEKPDQVVVVNGGDDRSDQIVHSYMDRLGIKVELVKTVNKNLATSRNIGIAHCNGEVIALTDDDAEVFPDWITQMKRVHAEHPEAGGVGGAVHGADSDKSLLSRISDVAVFTSPSQSGYVRTIAGVNASYKRSILHSVGQQDETLFRGEDVDFNWRIKQLGYKIFYSPKIKITHHHRHTLAGLIHQFYMYGRAYFLVRNKWPEMHSVFPKWLKSIKDFLKLAYFLVSIIVEPLKVAIKLRRWIDKISAFPLLLVMHCAWKFGMVRQRFWVKGKT